MLHLVEIYLRHLHLKNYSADPKTMLSLLRQEIWIVNGRRECTQIVWRCIHCFRYKPKLLGQIMGDLPTDPTFAAEAGPLRKPHRATHFGGLWEAAVKSAKGLLLRQIGDASLSEAEVRTHLAEVEAILNSRPLTPCSADPRGEALSIGTSPAFAAARVRARRADQRVAVYEQEAATVNAQTAVLASVVQGLYPGAARQGTLVIVQGQRNYKRSGWQGSSGRCENGTGVLKRPIHKLAVLPITFLILSYYNRLFNYELFFLKFSPSTWPKCWIRVI